MFSLPKLKKLRIHGPKPKQLQIERDDAGVPHISAKNVNDLNWGLGYCFAIDRGTQLQLMRIIGQGRLCELLEDSDDNLKIDRFFRRMHWSKDHDAQLQALDSETLVWCQALCDGINAGLRSNKLNPVKLLTGGAEPWAIKDIFLTLRMTSYLTLAQSQAEVERLFLELVQAGVSIEKLESLFPIKDQDFDIELIKKITLPERIVPSDVLWQSAAPRTMASNNWVISGEHTKSGSAMMANDPHLEVNRLPNVWYEAALSAPDFQGMGYSMPGIPGLLIGRTQDLSWGATYTFMDTIDSWVEECKNGKYKRGKSWKKFSVREEVILRKKHSKHIETFYENPHGVLEGNPNEEGLYLSTLWSPGLFGAQSLNASLKLTKAKNVRDAQNCFKHIESAWNWVLADSKGNIGYQMSGLCPKRSNNWNGFTPGLGWDASWDWQGFEKPEQLPNNYNPPEGFIVTANQDLNHLGSVSCINMPMGDYRAKRIEQSIESSSEHDTASNAKIQMDTYSLQAEQFLKILSPALETEADQCYAIKALQEWDRRYDTQSDTAVLFELFYSELRRVVFQDEALNPKLLSHLSEQTGLFIDFYQNFDRCLLDPASLWYESKTQEDCFKQAFMQAKEKWGTTTWGQRNSFRFTNILFQGKLPEWLGFDSPLVPLIGGRATPHQGQIFEIDGRKTSFAPSVRIIADMSESCLHTRTAGGVSDSRLSPWYMSEVQGWLDGTFKRLTS